MLINKKFFIFLLICCCQLCAAQEIKKEKDSARLYRNIEKFSKRSKFTKFLHGLIFEPIAGKKSSTPEKKPKVQKKKFRSYEGKIVRDINITTLDPFGYTETNPADLPTNYVSRVGNSIHIKSKQLNIKNLLLFKRNKPLDSLLVKESERLIRSQRYVRGVVIKPEVIVGNTDSVDVYIRVLDAWSLQPDIAVSGKTGNIKVKERNFLGTGHEFDNAYQKDFGTSKYGYSSRYAIPNILNTYIRTSLGYQIDTERNYGKFINVERPFFSPFAKWAAGVYIDQQFRTDSLPDAQNILGKQNFKYDSHDFWAGYSYQLFHGNTEKDRTTNFITTARYYEVNYLESPEIAYDSIDFYSDEKFYMVGMGISSRQFVEDKYIFNYGIVEDVPIGRAFAITGGVQDKNEIKRLYLGARFSVGKYHKWGYFSTNFEYGTFFNNAVTEQSAFAIQGNYFTNLIESGKWKFRQFMKARMVLGSNRQSSTGDYLTLDEQYGIPGFTGTRLYGTKKAILTIQSQAYAPGNFAGFRLNPYLSYSIGVLGDKGHTFRDSRAYSEIGIGLIVSNDFLVFSSFQISFAYYPEIPGSGQNIFKTNAFNTEDFGFLNFEVSKPRVVDYQ